MNEKKSDKIILDKIKQALDNLYDIDMLHHILNEKFCNTFGNLFPELYDKKMNLF